MNAPPLQPEDSADRRRPWRQLAAAWMPPPPLLATLLPLSYFLAAVAAMKLSGEAGNIAALWPAAAILLVALIRNPRAMWPALIVLAGGADLAAGLAMGSPAGTAAALAAIDVLEPLVIATALRRVRDGTAWFVSPRIIVLFGAIATAAAIGTALLGASLLAALHAAPFLTTWARWAVADTLGLLIVTPFLMSWTEKALRPALTRQGLVECILLTVATGLVAAVSFRSVSPFLFGVFPFLVLVTFRTGLPGATAGLAVLTVVAFWSTLNGSGPIAHLDHVQVFERIQILQIYLLSAALLALPIALILTHRAQLARELSQQAEIRNAALDNMAQGLSLFDADGRLIVCNRRFTELYGLPDRLAVPGTALRDMVEERIAAGAYAGTFEQYCRHVGLDGASGLAPNDVRIAGRVIEMSPKPLATGGWVTIHEDVTERRRNADQIAYLASHDPLTGLPNRAHFSEQLMALWAQTDRGHAFALHTLDLDHFKEVNDSLGHGAGDQILKQVAARLRVAVREGDVVTRLGGDEFAVLQHDVDSPEAAASLAGRIVEMLSAPYQCDGHEVEIGATVGVALAPRDAADAKDLMRKSDLALYRGKTDGRATVRFFEPEMDIKLREHRLLESGLRAALPNEEFELQYQPILDIERDSVTGFEALIRWRHPTRGLLQPADFIAAAEDSGLIVQIGEWVLDRACREAVAWPADVRLAVNLSPVQFKRGDLFSMISRALAESGLPAARLELEVTELVLLHDEEWVRAILYQLRKLGVGIAMDDFGTGYSSLAYLRNFPFSKIKIDRAFVCDISDKADSLAIVHATIDLSRKLGMVTTAEGVETRAQFDILKAEGCTEVQGFYVSKPLSAADAVRFIGAGTVRQTPKVTGSRTVRRPGFRAPAAR